MLLGRRDLFAVAQNYESGGGAESVVEVLGLVDIRELTEPGIHMRDRSGGAVDDAVTVSDYNDVCVSVRVRVSVGDYDEQRIGKQIK